MSNTWQKLKRLPYPVRLDWKKIITPDRYIIELHKKNKQEVSKRSVNAIYKTNPNIPSQLTTDVLFIKSMIRPDYNAFYDKVIQQCENDNQLVNLTYKDGSKSKIILLIKLIWHLPIFFKVYNKNLQTWLYSYLKAIQYLGILRMVRNYQFNTIVSFADMQGVENLLIQYFNKKGKQTVTLQHGLYVDYSAFDNINRVNYENVVSQHFLAWGEETKELIEKYHPDVNIFITGKPLHFDKKYRSIDYFTLVCDQSLFMEQNQELITISYEVAKKFGLKVNVRLHPWDTKKRYRFNDELTCYDEDVTASNFVIGHTTSMIFECMRHGIPAFKYKTRYPANQVRDELMFENADELIERVQEIEKFDFKREGKYYLQYVGDESLERYRTFFKNFIPVNN